MPPISQFGLGCAAMDSNSLRLVDLISSDGKLAPGLVPVSKIGMEKTALCVDEQAALQAAKFFGNINYIFFRRFSDGRSSQVSAYVVDNSDERLDEKALAELHQQVWLYGMAPLLYVARPGRIDILTCARKADFWGDRGSRYKPVDVIRTTDLITKELQNYSSLRLADGTFWEEPRNRVLTDYAQAAHQLLIRAVVEADIELDGKNNPVKRRLLLLMILIKYLEDRRVFPNDWFDQFHKGAKRFFDVLKGGYPEEVYKLLDSLELRFNGDIFVLPQQQKLTKEILKTFAILVEARTLKKQRYLWDQYSFEHLPVEIISHLYQRFVQGGHGAVYTPPFLASLLLDYAMPYSELTGQERVIDPACGSGVFLVGAFRRLINVWRSRNKWQRPEVGMLKELVRQKIYGIEIDKGAIDLTAFSLSLAICDALQPNVIWEHLKFDSFRNSNLFERDFFGLLQDSQKGEPSIFNEGFDIVIGNPPFKSELSPEGKAVNQIAQREDTSRGTLPDNQMAYLFLEQALKVLSPGGRVCLIQPHGFLYNRNSENFRKVIFRKNKVDTIFDLISIRELYKAADTKTIAVLAHDSPPPANHRIKHWTFRRTVSVKERICFELDYYDRHHISQEQVETDPYVWRANLLGGGRLIELSQRFQKMRKLVEYVKEKRWDYGEGFIVAKTGRRTPAPFLTGKRLLPTSAFTESGIDKDKIETVDETHFRSPYSKGRFSAPLVLIKEVDSLPVAFWDEGFLAYRNQIVGIHAPPSEVSELRKFYATFSRNQEILRFACTLNGTRSLAGKSTSILKHDIDMLSYPIDIRDFSFSFWEEALCQDVLKYMTKYVRLGQNSDLLKKAAIKDDLRKYSSLFIRMLGSVYDNLRASDPIFLNGLICQQFYFGERPGPSWINNQSEDELRKLIYTDEKHEHLRTIRVLRLYSENVLLLIKPDRLRYWIGSTAIRDADDTLINLRHQGY